MLPNIQYPSRVKTRDLAIIAVLIVAVPGILLPHAFSEGNYTYANRGGLVKGPAGNTFDLKINGTFSSGQTEVKLLNVTSDSRCPDTAACVWSGEAKVLVGVLQGNQSVGNFTLSTLQGRNNIAFGSSLLTLENVSPNPKVGSRIGPADYLISFALSPVKNGTVSIENPVVQPSTIRVGDNFTITATLVNNSPGTISVHNDCLSPFSVTFDGHAKFEVIKPCIYFAISKQLGPGQNMTVTGPGANIAYRAVAPGNANATIRFSYTPINQTSNATLGPGPLAVSKSFSFTISPSGVPAMPSTPSPLSQFRSGIAPGDVKCNEGLQLAFKAADGSPACVMPDTAAKLVAWGWAKTTAYGSPLNGTTDQK